MVDLHKTFIRFDPLKIGKNALGIIDLCLKFLPWIVVWLSVITVLLLTSRRICKALMQVEPSGAQFRRLSVSMRGCCGAVSSTALR